MVRSIYPDNTVLVNLTIIDRHDLLTWLSKNGTLKWTPSIREECHQSSTFHGLANMSKWSGVFGNPVQLTSQDYVNAQSCATSMRKPGDYWPNRHLGEAETICVAERDKPALFLTDDYDAKRVARSRGLDVWSTTKLIAMAEVGSIISGEEARLFFHELKLHDRVLGDEPTVEEYPRYVKKCLKAFRGYE